MRKLVRWSVWGAAAAGFILLGLSIAALPLAAQNSSGKPKIAGDFEKVQLLPPGGPTPRLADGRPDFTGRWYPNSAGKMLQGAYPVDPRAMRQFDPKETPEVAPLFKPDADPKYTRAAPYGGCDQPGTPTVTLEQAVQHAPMELISNTQRVAMLYEYPLDVRMVYTNRRTHPEDPDPTFNGDSTTRWEGDTLVIDTIAIDERLRNIVGFGPGPGIQWYPSDKEHVIERISRPSKNYLVYQVTIEDPEVLTKPWTSAPRKWSLAPADDEWTEVFCTLNEEPGYWNNTVGGEIKQNWQNMTNPATRGQ